MDEKPIRTMIVDDEPLARALIASFVAEDPSLEMVGECENGADALAAISQLSPDLLFLDVQMPILDGVGLVERLLHRRDMPYIVFVTAYDAYAIRAFELNVLDYLLKPIERDRFAAVLARAKAAIRERQLSALAKRMLGVVHTYRGDDEKPAPQAEHILINTGQRLVSLSPMDIVWLEAANQYVHIHTGHDRYVMSENLGQFAKRVDGQQFVRVHRSAIINLQYVQSVARKGSGAHLITLKGGAQVVLSRGRADLLPLLLSAANNAERSATDVAEGSPA